MDKLSTKRFPSSSHMRILAQIILKLFFRGPLARLGRGQLVGADANRLKFPEMAEMIKKDYERKGNRSADRLEDHLNSLEEFFGADRAVDITTERIEAYVDKCRKGGSKFGTIQNRLACQTGSFMIFGQPFATWSAPVSLKGSL